MTLRAAVDTHITKMNDFIETQVRDMKELRRQLDASLLQVSSMEEDIKGHIAKGTASREELQALVDGLNGELQSSLEGAKTVATNITTRLDKFAAGDEVAAGDEAAPEAAAAPEAGGGKRMKRSRRSNRGRKSMRK